MKFTSSKLFALAIVAALFSFFTPSAYSGDSDSEAVARIKEKRLDKEELALKKKKQCISLMNEQTAALAAKDWENLDRLAKSYAGQCKGVFEAEWLSAAHENIAMANNAERKFKYALVASDACTQAYYGNPGCYIQKASALMSLGKKVESGKSLNIAERLARHALEGARRDLSQARSELDKEMHTAAIFRLESYLNLIDSIRSKLTQ